MWIPLDLHFDGKPNGEDSAVHIPMIYQGAPYDQAIKVKDENGAYRDFRSYAEINMHIRLKQDDATPFLSLSKLGNDLDGTIDSFTFNISAAKTADLVLPYNTGANIAKIPFVFDIELLIGGLVVERFAHGTGIFCTNTTRGV